MNRQPNRCERCLIIWAPEAVPVALWHHRGFHVCTDRRACDGRIRWTARFERLLRTPPPGALRPQELAELAPLVNLRPDPPPRGDGR